jgi:hypothetical protein
MTAALGISASFQQMDEDNLPKALEALKITAAFLPAFLGNKSRAARHG